MDIVTDVAETELLAILRTLSQQDAGAAEPDTITSGELAAALGCSQSTAAMRLKRALAAGVVEAAMVKRTNVWNHTRTMCGYRLVKE